jgi:hypothetical protein
MPHSPKGATGQTPGGSPANGVAGPNLPTGKPIKLPKHYPNR